MMALQKRISAFAELGKFLSREPGQLDNLIQHTYLYNNWFTEENVRFSLQAIIEKYLKEECLSQWLQRYTFQEPKRPKTVGIVMAGNIPLVGFHDFLSVLISGNKVQVKLSSKDKLLLPFIADSLVSIEPGFKEKNQFTDTLKDFDAVIATGSNNSARYFEYYFGKYPHLIRKNRGSVAILTDVETAESLQLLAKDIFEYFGLGCRNVSKIYVPKGYELEKLLESFGKHRELMDHNKYKNNYDYNRTVLLMNKATHLANDFCMLVEKEEIHSPVATLHYEYYRDESELVEKIRRQEQAIQCVVADELTRIKGASGTFIRIVPFGKSQQPELWDYADGADTMRFLLDLPNCL